jgi:ATP diphosphatase
MEDPTAALQPRPEPAGGRIDALRALVEALRGPGGCPWDRKQGPRDLRAYLLEEAHEVAAALDVDDWGALRSELGDLLFQIVFLTSLAQESGHFGWGEVVDGVHSKMVERHPHVFEAPAGATAAGSGAAATPRLAGADDVRQAWERRKAADRSGAQGSLLDGVAASLPALVAAYRLTQKAAGVGFDWPDLQSVFGKLDEEVSELHRAIDAGDRPQIEAELGDALFSLANVARHLEIDPEAALARTNLKFRRRFAFVERALAETERPVGKASLEEMDALWERAKDGESPL